MGFYLLGYSQIYAKSWKKIFFEISNGSSWKLKGVWFVLSEEFEHDFLLFLVE